MKLLLVLQYWDGDRDLAMKLARVIADLESNHSDQADFLFFYRFDAKRDIKTEEYVGRKFNIWSERCKRRASGWPFGPNELWFGAMDWIYSMSEAKKLPQYKAIMTFEADCCPITPHWIERLSESWDAAQVPRATYIHGPLLQYPGVHINGNSLFSGSKNFLLWVARKQAGCAPHQGWDYVLAPKFKQWGWKDCSIMKSYWRKPSIERGEFNQEVSRGTVFLHGVKDDSGLKLCRQFYSLPPH